MSELPISGSEDALFDPIQELWFLSTQVRDGYEVSSKLRSVSLENVSLIEQKVGFAVIEHLDIAGRLAGGMQVDEQQFGTLIDLWDDVNTELQQHVSKLTPRSHAFHMRLASKHADYYRSFETKLVEDFVKAARLKSEFLKAVTFARNGEFPKAADMGEAISRSWREGLPTRLPGLYRIERSAAVWALAAHDASLSQKLMQLAAEADNPLKAAYEEDAPSLARPPRKLEITVRFGFAASVIPAQLYA